jgi:hypothetical protein
MKKLRDRRSFASTYALSGVLVIGLITGALIAERAWPWCPADWNDAPRIDLGGSFADVMLDGSPYRVGGSALLDFGLQARRHPLGISASISAPSRTALGEPVFTCFRAIRDGEVWAGRPTTYGTQTMADGYPPGAKLPANNEAWRQAHLNDGPEWSEGDRIGLEFWARIHGRPYTFVVPTFALMKGL